MNLNIDLNNHTDVLAGHAFLMEYLAKHSQAGTISAPPVPPTPDDIAAQAFIDALWPRLGQSMRRLVKKVAELTTQQPMITIHDLATGLGRPEKSVRASMNGPLAIAIKNVKLTVVPGAPDLFVWQHNGSVYELGITVDIRAALDTKPLF
jgi:hypothetical protein